MKKYLVNISNHPSDKWSQQQLQAASKIAENIIDIQFPNVPPHAKEQQIIRMAKEYLQKVKKIGSPSIVAVHLMGEMNFTHTLANMLKSYGYDVYASTTERVAVEKDGVKTSVFNFGRFRKYV